MLTFFPKEDKFFVLLKRATKNVVEGSRALKSLMEDFTNPHEMVAKIKEIEHKGDLITHEIVRNLNQTFITPLDREDLHALASALDDILDEIDEVANRFTILQVQKPTPTAIKLADTILQGTLEVNSAIERLGKGPLDLNECCIKVNTLENEADRITDEAIFDLFQNEKDPITLIKWKEIYEKLEEGTDRCEDVANILERIALKSA